MLTHALPLTVPVSRSPARRLADALREAWRGWRASRDAHRTVDLLATLDDHTLRDIGASAEMRAYVEARQAGAYQRLSDLMR
jgi:uncharacterized protein YjiS (DUF1127 family)